MIYATFCIVDHNGEKCRLFCYGGTSQRELAKLITEHLNDQFEVTLKYFSRTSGKTLTRNTSNLGYELEKAHGQLRMFTNLLAKLDAYPMSRFAKEDFEGSFEFFSGKDMMWFSFCPYVEGLPAFLEEADLFLYSQGLWDKLPKDFMQYTDEAKAFQVVYDILDEWNRKQDA